MKKKMKKSEFAAYTSAVQIKNANFMHPHPCKYQKNHKDLKPPLFDWHHSLKAKVKVGGNPTRSLKSFGNMHRCNETCCPPHPCPTTI